MALNALDDKKSKITIPVDPRKATIYKIGKFNDTDADFEDRIAYWASYYNVELPKKIEENIYIGTSFNYKAPEPKGNPWELASESVDLEIPEGYVSTQASYDTGNSGDWGPGGLGHNAFYSYEKVIVGNKKIPFGTTQLLNPHIGKIPVSYSQGGALVSSVNISIQCQLTPEARAQYRMQCFNTIIKGYEEAVRKYNEQIAMENDKAVQIKGSNPGFYRQIENQVLRKKLYCLHDRSKE
jgi:hypothetical protein